MDLFSIIIASKRLNRTMLNLNNLKTKFSPVRVGQHISMEISPAAYHMLKVVVHTVVSKALLLKVFSYSAVFRLLLKSGHALLALNGTPLNH